VVRRCRRGVGIDDDGPEIAAWHEEVAQRRWSRIEREGEGEFWGLVPGTGLAMRGGCGRNGAERFDAGADGTCRPEVVFGRCGGGRRRGVEESRVKQSRARGEGGESESQESRAEDESGIWLLSLSLRF